jgi:hypothetical protein
MPKGGKREGAGRPKGARTSPATRLTRIKASAIMNSGLSPLDVMMANLRFWHREKELLEEGILSAAPEGTAISQLEERPILKRYFEVREALQMAAEKAAPYVHPRMSPVHDDPGGRMQDLSRLTDAELDALERLSRKIAGSYGDPGGEDKAPR